MERHVESNPVAQDVAVVELGREKNNEQLLNKYLILHCAKLHLTVTDASSGEYIPNLQRRMGAQSHESFHSELLRQHAMMARQRSSQSLLDANNIFGEPASPANPLMKPILRVNVQN